MSDEFVHRALAIFLRHPNDRLLIAMRDGEMRENARERVEKHLERCAKCHLRVIQIEKDWQRLAALNAAAEPAASEKELLPGIKSSILQWKAGRAAGLSNDEAARRVESVLGIYLGKKAAAALKGEDWAQGGLTGVGSALRILLGEKSALVIEKKIQRITGRVVESAGRSSTS